MEERYRGRKIKREIGLEREREREPQKKRGMVGDRKIGRERERERQPLRGRRRDRGDRKINKET